MTKKLKINNIDVDISFKDIKNVHLSVHPPDGRVTVSAPRHIDLETLKIYTATKLSWIKKEQNKFIGQQRQAGKQYSTRESHYFLGKRYLLLVTRSPQAKVVLHHSKIELQVPDHFNSEMKEKLLYRFYREELRNVLRNLVATYAKKMRLKTPDFGIKKMKTKWGSCSIEREYLWLNVELAKKPQECIEYVVVHEMVHLLERHHNKQFSALLDRYFPNWQVRKQLLNELPLYHQ